MNHLGLSVRPNDLEGFVGAAAVDHHDALRPGQSVEGTRDIRFFIVGNHDWGDIFDHDHPESSLVVSGSHCFLAIVPYYSPNEHAILFRLICSIANLRSIGFSCNPNPPPPAQALNNSIV